MATVTDVEVANASFPNVRQDLNDILEALATNFSADAEPTTMYPNQFWYETDTNLLKFRNEDNDAWITLAYFDQTADEWEVRTAVVQAVDAAGLALKTDDGTTRFSISDAGVVSFENYAFPSADGTAGQVLSTDGSGTLTFEDAGAGDKIEEGNSSVEVVDTGTGYVAVTLDGGEKHRFTSTSLGIGTNNPATNLEIAANSATVGAKLRLSNFNTTINAAGTAGEIEFYNADTSSGAGISGFIKNVAINAGQNYALTFGSGNSTNVAEHMRLDAGGNLQFNSGFGSVATAYGCRAWVNFNGTGTLAIRNSGGVSSVTDIGTGDYKVNFSFTMPDVDYTWTATGDYTVGSAKAAIVTQRGNVLTGSCEFAVTEANTGYTRIDTGVSAVFHR